MKKTSLFAAVIVAAGLLAGCSDGSDTPVAAAVVPLQVFESVEALGEALFSDTDLSLNRTQACSTCHNPELAFIDDRFDDNGERSAVSEGDDGISLGDRNTPTAAYAMLAPEFHFGSHERFNSHQPDYTGFIGGQFLDGRALTGLAEQAEGPPTNPIEMAMPDRASVVERLRENPDYEASFKALFSDSIFENTDDAYQAMAQAIAAFEMTEEFAPFDSKYDRFLTGDYIYEPDSKAELGKNIFFSAEFTNCATCHQLRPKGNRKETFSNYEYHNIGIPENSWVRAINGKEENFVDPGLLDNPEVKDEAEKGKFKVPTLRNVAVTGPYMHNGVFRRLETVMQFYGRFTDSDFTVNPETGSPWRDPEVPETVALTELEDGRKLTQEWVEGLVCFMRTLTDARYEHLIQDEGIDCGE